MRTNFPDTGELFNNFQPELPNLPDIGYKDTMLKEALDDLEKRMNKRYDESDKMTKRALNWAIVAAVSGILSAAFTALSFFLK